MLPEEKTLIKISLLCALIGIAALFVIQKSENASPTRIDAINDAMLNKHVKATGTIASLKEHPSLVIIKLKDETGTIDVIAWRSDMLELRKGERIEVEGKISKYKENLQVEAETIKSLP